MTDELTAEQLNGFYQDIAYDLGVDIAVRMYENYRGMQIVFPTKLLDSNIIKQRIWNDFDGKNYKKIASKYGYSERWVRKILDTMAFKKLD